MRAGGGSIGNGGYGVTAYDTGTPPTRGGGGCGGSTANNYTTSKDAQSGADGYARIIWVVENI